MKLFSKNVTMKNFYFNFAVLIPATARDSDYWNFEDSDLYQTMKSFYETCDNQHLYTFFIGIDKNDWFYQDSKIKDQIFKFISDKPKSSVQFIEFDKSFKNDIAGMWTKLYKEAYNNYDYFVQVGSDIKFLDKGWVEDAIKIFAENNNLGVVGFQDFGRQQINKDDKLFTQTIVTKQHFEIFGFYFPPEIKNWGCDDWIGDIYEVNNLKHYIPQRIINSGGRPRYKVCRNFNEQYANSMIKYMNNIQMFISKKDFEYPFAENSQPKG